MNSLRAYMEKENRSRIFIFCWFFFFLLLFSLLFHGFVYHDLHLTQPLEFMATWFPQIAVSLFIAAPVWITKRNWWTILILFILDVWIIANILYFRANNILLTYHAITMAKNVGGVGGSILMFVNWKSAIFLILTVVYAVVAMRLAPVNRTEPNKRTYISNISILLAAFIFSFSGNYANSLLRMRASAELTRAQMSNPFADAFELSVTDPFRYVEQHSVLTYLPIAFLQGAVADTQAQAEVPPVLNEKEREKMELLDDTSSKTEPVPTRDLILICVESLESWPLEIKDQTGAYVTPNLHALSQSTSSFYAPRMKSQVRHGVSSDGHMILNTGILPLQNGAACRLLPDNTYPNYAHLFKSSVLVNAVAPDFWNNATAARNYGYRKMVKPDFDQGKVEVFEKVMDLSWSDAEMFLHAAEEWKAMDKPRCLMALTLSSHSPFTLVPENESMVFPASLPKAMKAYFSCLHYTDSCIGVFLKDLEETGELDNTVVVITGDHTVFKSMLWWEFQQYMERHGMPKMPDKNYVPCIIMASDMERQYRKSDCWQADIYPTILSLIGCEQYYWKGVGRNLFDSNKRILKEQDAYILSDKLLRSNYFAPADTVGSKDILNNE